MNIGSVLSNAARGTPNWYDGSVYDQIGKVGLGDIDIAENDSMLWVTSLNDKKLIGIPLDSTGAANAAAAQVYSIPDLGCPAGHR